MDDLVYVRMATTALAADTTLHRAHMSVGNVDALTIPPLLTQYQRWISIVFVISVGHFRMVLIQPVPIAIGVQARYKSRATPRWTIVSVGQLFSMDTVHLTLQAIGMAFLLGLVTLAFMATVILVLKEVG